MPSPKNKDHSFLLSIIMPVYNVELYLEEALDSVLNQSMTDFAEDLTEHYTELGVRVNMVNPDAVFGDDRVKYWIDIQNQMIEFK